MSLKTHSLSELKKLNNRIIREIERRESQSKAQVLKKMARLAADAGLKLEDLIGSQPEATVAQEAKLARAGKKSKVKAKVAPKYKHPSDSSLTWTGRGRKPLWVEAWLGTGRSLESLAIAAGQ